MIRAWRFLLLIPGIALARISAQSDRPAEESTPPEAMATVQSQLGTFVVRGRSQDNCVTVLRWAEGRLESIQGYLNQTIPFRPLSRIQITLHSPLEGIPPSVRASQHYSAGNLIQSLVIHDLARADQEDVLEALTRLLLCRLLNPLETSESPPPELHAPPDWFSVGLAQLSEEKTRERNRYVLRTQLQAAQPDIAGVQDLLSAASIPPGRWNVKADCCAFVAWLLDGPEPRNLLTGCFAQWRRHPAIKISWLVARFPEADDLLDLEKLWALYLLDWGGRATPSNPNLAQATERLETLFLIPARDWLGWESGAPESIPISGIVLYNRETWYLPLIARLNQELVQLLFAQPHDYQEIVKGYMEWLKVAALLVPPPDEKLRVFPEEVLLRRSDAAYTRARTAYLRWTRQREVLQHYLDQLTHAAQEAPKPTQPLPRSAQQRYIDKYDMNRPYAQP